MAMQSGFVRHYSGDHGYGFVSIQGRVDDTSMFYFHLTRCDIQTPPPQVGERVLFLHNDSATRPEVTSLTRAGLRQTQQTPPPSPPRPTTATAKTKTKSNHLNTRELDVNAARNAADRAIRHKRALLADAPSCYQGAALPRYVYVDLDNVWVSFVRGDYLLDQFPGAVTTRDLELDLEGLTGRLAEGGSGVVRLVAFYFNTPEPIAHKLHGLSFGGVRWDVRKQETTSDTTMQLELLNAKRPCAAHPKTLVLVTGDGNVAPNGICFREIMDLYLRDGWCVEIHAWLATMHTVYVEYQREYGSVAVVRPFDDEDVGEIVRLRRAAVAPASRATPASAREPPVARTTNKPRGRAKPQQNKPTRQIDEVRATTHTQPAPVAEVASQSKPAASYRPEQFDSVISQLDGPDGELFVPAAINMLLKIGSRVDLDLFRSVDVETQRLLLSSALQDEMDAATRVLLTQEPAF